MKRIVLLLALVALPLSAAERQRYLVSFDRDPLAASERAARHEIRFERGYSVELTADEAAALAKRDGVRLVERDEERFVSTMQPAPRLEAAQIETWPLEALHVRAAWTITRGEGTRVAIIDTGIDATHPDLMAAYAGGYDFVHNDSNPEEEAIGDASGHGTRMAGVIAAADNALGVVGLAPAARIYALKVFPRTGGALTSNVIRAIDWAIANGMDVVNCSFGGDKPTAIEEAAYARARRANVLVIAAVGNDGTFVRYPAAYASVVAVGAVTRSLAVASFSNRGEAVDLVAPGADIVSTMRSGLGLLATVTTADGTYIASPIRNSPSGLVAGAAIGCGTGLADEFPAAVASQVAVMRRGTAPYNSMTANARNAGAAAQIFVDDGPDDRALNLVIAEGLGWPVSISIGSTAGAKLNGEVVVDSYLGDYENAHGTSMAAPFVSGVAALVRSARPDLTADEVAALLARTAHDLGEPGCDALSGCGLVDAFAAVAAAKPPATRRRSSRS